MFKEQINRFGIRTRKNKKITDTSSIISDYQNESARSLYNETNFQDKCNGIIYSGGRHDGNVLVVYPQFIKGIIPLAVTDDEGKTWKKIDISDEAQKASYMNANSNMNLIQKNYEQIVDKDYIIRKINSPDDYDEDISIRYKKIFKDNPFFKITSIKKSDYFFFQKGNIDIDDDFKYAFYYFFNG